MPYYDYECEANNRIVEVKHSINERLATWGELCEKAGIELGDTPADTPINRKLGGAQVISSSAMSNPSAPSCGAGGCGSGMCGIH